LDHADPSETLPHQAGAGGRTRSISDGGHSVWNPKIPLQALEFKRFQTAEITISGIELAEKIRKHQFKTGNLPGRPAIAPDIWAAILAA
jgi:hypothetical protein